MMPSALIYRDVVLPASELGFMRRQYLGFSQLRPVWIGRRITPLAGQAGLVSYRLGGEGPLGGIRRSAFKAVGAVPCLASLRGMQPIVIHAQFGRGGAFALPIARALEIPLVVTFHGGDAHKDSHYRGFPPSLFARRLPALMTEAKAFICVSANVRDRLLDRGFPALKLIVLPIGTEIPAEMPDRPTEGPVLFVGRFVPKKGLAVLIDALQQLRAEGREPETVVIGDGPMAEAMRRRADGLRHIRFVGWQKSEAVAALMAEAALLVVPSIRAAGGDAEGLPSVAVEAMAQGLPVLASGQAGLSGIVVPGHTGALVPAGDPAALAKAIAALTADPTERKRLGEAGRDLVRRDYDARIQSRRLEALLLETAA